MEKFKEEDIVVVYIEDYSDIQEIGEIYKVERRNSNNYIYGSNFGLCQKEKNLRLATQNEIIAYNSGIRNIKVNVLETIEIY